MGFCVVQAIAGTFDMTTSRPVDLAVVAILERKAKQMFSAEHAALVKVLANELREALSALPPSEEAETATDGWMRWHVCGEHGTTFGGDWPGCPPSATRTTKEG